MDIISIILLVNTTLLIFAIYKYNKLTQSLIEMLTKANNRTILAIEQANQANAKANIATETLVEYKDMVDGYREEELTPDFHMDENITIH